MFSFSFFTGSEIPAALLARCSPAPKFMVAVAPAETMDADLPAFSSISTEVLPEQPFSKQLDTMASSSRLETEEKVEINKSPALSCETMENAVGEIVGQSSLKEMNAQQLAPSNTASSNKTSTTTELCTVFPCLFS